MKSSDLIGSSHEIEVGLSLKIRININKLTISFNSSNLILLVKQTERLLSGLDLVYKMSTPRRYCYLT